MTRSAVYDAVVVGASLAGCTAARLLALRGLRVALVEQHVDPHWHKRMCTHYIQASAVPAIERLGLAPLIEEAGAVRSRVQIWTRYGWLRHGEADGKTYGYSLRRQTLDPIVRRLAAETPGVELLLGSKVQELAGPPGKWTGVTIGQPGGATRSLEARAIVVADGRNSQLAKWAELPIKLRPNRRFVYFAYYRDVPLASGDDSQFWMLDPDAAYALPNDDGITLLAVWPTKDKLAEFRQDRYAALERFARRLPDGPRWDRGQRISEVTGGLDLPIEFRWAARGPLALIGDAALAADPLWGVGCGWAFQSGQWLADHLAPALLGGGSIERALDAYREFHRRQLGGHWFVISRYARGRRFSWPERLYYAAGAHDAAVAEALLAFGARRVGPTSLLAPGTVGRVVANALRGRVKSAAISPPNESDGDQAVDSVGRSGLAPNSAR